MRMQLLPASRLLRIFRPLEPVPSIYSKHGKCRAHEVLSTPTST
jgi:hypothetical protein